MPQTEKRAKRKPAPKTRKKKIPAKPNWKESILELRGLGKHIWQGVDPDEYVRQLREGWE